jgi:hypothetical protein
MDAIAAQSLPARSLADQLRNADRTIGSPLFDALLLWGSPLLAAVLVWLWADISSLLPPALGNAAVSLLVGAIGVLTFAHLIAVVPRAYLNREVFGANRRRLTIVPVALIAALFASPTLLLLGGVAAVFWDVHHSAMQTFGLGRIYDLKAGQDGTVLRRTDLVLNWILYVGPIGAGAALLVHLHELDRLGPTPLAWLAQAPGLAQMELGAIRIAVVVIWIAGLAFAALAYATEHRRGYRMPPHKLALLISTGATSIIAWAFSPPFVAFAIVNLFHAVQYFALVWLKEGKRIEAALPRGPALTMFFGFCAAFGLAYFAAKSFALMLTPFIACSLLHFWFDSFIWSVRKKQV